MRTELQGEPQEVAASQQKSQAHYRDLAIQYDHATRYINGVRNKTLAALNVQAGDVVLDVGCGTGYCLIALARAAGPAGHVIGFEHSAEMLAVAQERIREAGLSNVTLIHATAEAVTLPPEWHGKVNRLLFSYVHDVMNSPAALTNMLAQVAQGGEGARVAACSTKLFAPWWFIGNWYLRWSHREYITNFTNFDAPWRLLATHCAEFEVTPQAPGSRYIATGKIRVST